MVHWRKNLFRISMGRLGKEFVLELAGLFREYAFDSMMECIALKDVMTMPSLLLQQTHLHFKPKEDMCCLERRLLPWKKRDIAALVAESQPIQIVSFPLDDVTSLMERIAEQLCLQN